MAAFMSSDDNPANVPLSQQRALAWDGAWYSRDDFADAYGPANGLQLWEEIRADTARCGVLAYDGIVYSHEEYFNYYYGSDADARSAAKPLTDTDADDWSAAKPLTDSDPGQRASANDIACGSGSSAEPAQHDGPDADARSAAKPLTDTDPGQRASVNDIASGSASSARPTQHDEPDADVRSAANDVAPGSGSAAKPVLLTVAGLDGIATRLGGKIACQEQRRLRAIVLRHNAPHPIVDMENDTDFDWRAMLKSLPHGQMIIGCGVTAVNFRLPPHVMDHNYIKKDSGEKHVFEIVRADASRVLLHYHKNGNCDPPELIAANDRSDPVCPYLSQPKHIGVAYTCQPPTTYNDIVSSNEAGDRSAPLGRAEATIALRNLLLASLGKSRCGALNLTDGCAFPWPRYLKNVTQCREVVGPGIERVYAARYHSCDGLVLLLCRADGSYVELRPGKKNEHKIMEGELVNWRTLQILDDAEYMGVSWMQVRSGLSM